MVNPFRRADMNTTGGDELLRTGRASGDAPSIEAVTRVRATP
jgi:hypothetical protein